MNNTNHISQRNIVVAAAVISTPFILWAAISLAPNNAAVGTAVPPTAFPNPTATTSPQIVPYGMNPTQPSGELNAPAGSSQLAQPGVAPSATPNCTSTGYGQPCIQ